MNVNIKMGEILGKAWKITWKFKILWLFGILASCSEGGRNNFNNSSSDRNIGNGNFPDLFRGNSQEAFNSFVSEYGVILILITSLVCVLALLFFFLGTVGKTGLIAGVHKADLGAEKLGFGELWDVGLKYLWRMVGFSLLISIPFFIVFVILLVIFFAGIGSSAMVDVSSDPRMIGSIFATLGIFIPAICCLAIVGIIVGLIVEQAKNAMVIHDLGVFESLQQGWDVFKTNFLAIILISIILWIISFLISLVISIPLLLVLLPIIMTASFNSSGAFAGDTNFAPLAVGAICFLAYLPILVFLRGVLQTYVQSALTLTYLRLTAPAPEPVNA